MVPATGPLTSLGGEDQLLLWRCSAGTIPGVPPLAADSKQFVSCEPAKEDVDIYDIVMHIGRQF